MAARTHNFHVQALKRFGAWLVDWERETVNPFDKLQTVRVTEAEHVHDRRALTDEEFALLVESAETGPALESMTGPDRAMLYILAAWTGYRRAELASLTLRSLDLDGEPPTVSVQPGYTKNKNRAVLHLHPTVAARLREWLATKGGLEPDAPLFALRTAGGHWRRTARWMEADLDRARQKWIAKAKTPEERGKRAQTDFLAYRTEDGLFADFHANRHTFITNLGRAGVPLTTAQKLARHSDPRLTSNIYTHLGVHDQAAAIEALPGAPERRRFNEPAHSPQNGKERTTRIA
jgi:integrase